jgi:hypothetical protein
VKHCIFFLLFFFQAVCVSADSFGVARSATPVLNTPTFATVFGGADGRSLKTDRCGQVRELEYIALPGTAFKVVKQLRAGAATIFKVETDDYPSPAKTSLYVDSRFVELVDSKPPQRVRRLPSRQEIVESLKGAVGQPYVWGGNVQGGIAELVELFYGGKVPASTRNFVTLAGLDCSGLLYQATNGWTPRNTSQLISYGRPVSIAGKSAENIAKLLELLDLIVWNGHVIIVLDAETVIESRLECGKKGNGGVVLTPLRQRLAEIMRGRKPVDSWPQAGKLRDIFVVRRWASM